MVQAFTTSKLLILLFSESSSLEYHEQLLTPVTLRYKLSKVEDHSVLMDSLVSTSSRLCAHNAQILTLCNLHRLTPSTMPQGSRTLGTGKRLCVQPFSSRFGFAIHRLAGTVLR